MILALEDLILHFWVVFLDLCLKEGVRVLIHLFFIAFAYLCYPIVCLFPDFPDRALFQGLSLRYFPLTKSILPSSSVLHEQKLILTLVGDDGTRDRNTSKGLSHILNHIRLDPQTIWKILIDPLHEILFLIGLVLIIGKRWQIVSIKDVEVPLPEVINQPFLSLLFRVIVDDIFHNDLLDHLRG